MGATDMTLLDLDDLIGDAPNVWTSRYRHRGDRRVMSGREREMEDTHIVISAAVAIPADDPRASEIAQALVAALARFGL